MSQQKDSGQTESQLTLLPEDSHARTSRSQARAQASRVSSQGYGQKSPDLLARYDPATSSWRTSQRCLVEGWTRFSETWPRSGMTRNGIAYQLPPLAPLTGATGGGVWRTPNARDHKGAQNGSERLAAGHTMNLNDQVKDPQMWPTPTTSDYKGSGPTVMRKDGKNRINDRLDYATEQTTEQSGQLSPTWVCWLMGFPLDWLDLDGYQSPELEGLPPEYLTEPTSSRG